MGASAAKSDLDRKYREMAAAWLRELAARHDLKSQEKIAQALGVDRATASRYLSTATRPPLQRLQYVERTLGDKVPPEVVEAFWLSEVGPAPAPPSDLETEINRLLDTAFKGKTPDEQRAVFEEMRQAIQRTGEKD